MGFNNFFILGANHAQFSLFSILVFVLTETLVMYFFIATGKSIKQILSEQKNKNSEKLWNKVKNIKKIIFPHIMLTIFLISTLYIFYFGYIQSERLNDYISYAWLQLPLLLLSVLHHLWSLKIKNYCFKKQIDIITQMSG